MKQFKLMMMAALAALMSFSVVSCSDDDDDSAQSKHDKKMEAVSAEVKANKSMTLLCCLLLSEVLGTHRRKPSKA